MPIDSVFEDISERSDWGDAVERMREDSSFGRFLAHYRHPKTRWTALHYAARDGNLDAAKELIRHGAMIYGISGSHRPVDIAKDGSHLAVASVLYDAQAFGNGNWASPEESSYWPCSNWWSTAKRTVAKEDMKVAYAGTVVDIAQGKTYYEDSLGRVLIGWHGSYNPPLGMDGESAIK